MVMERHVQVLKSCFTDLYCTLLLVKELNYIVYTDESRSTNIYAANYF